MLDHIDQRIRSTNVRKFVSDDGLDLIGRQAAKYRQRNKNYRFYKTNYHWQTGPGRDQNIETFVQTQPVMNAFHSPIPLGREGV